MRTRLHFQALTLLLVPLAFGQEQPKSANPKDAPATPPATQPPAAALRPEELQQARLVRAEQAQLVRVALAKLDKNSLERKQRLGRLKAFLDALEEQAQTVAGEIQQGVDRQGQLMEQLNQLRQLRNARGGDDRRLDPLIVQSQTAVDAAKARLEKLARLRTRVRQQLDALKEEHLTELLGASVEPPSGPGSESLELEQLVETALQSPPQAKER